ncbi:hypothetical protein DPMN_194135 [Dreissena polymorpha]|uniref:Uncharacterized protein n=1 Tax=Dreissena polymorpha TaxID=45954 RepID=A0A9D3Y4G3_DREPO|nr:hypothetical protein DPMN_194135 [Dreissena polymorpha]
MVNLHLEMRRKSTKSAKHTKIIDKEWLRLRLNHCVLKNRLEDAVCKISSKNVNYLSRYAVLNIKVIRCG